MNAEDFAAAIRADPENLDLRMVAADWYEEQGDPRAEFIRLQLALRNVSEQHEWYADFSSREQSLLEEYRPQWDQALRQQLQASLVDLDCDPQQGNLRSWTYHGGFVEELQVEAKYLLDHWDELVQIGPVRTLHLVKTTPERLLEIAQHPGFQRITGLRARRCSLDDDTLHAILDAADLSRLAMLDLADNYLSDTTTGYLEMLHLPALKQLILTDNRLSADEFSSLLRRFGDIVQNEKGEPAWVWMDDLDRDRDPQVTGESYDDEALYQNGRKVQEDEQTSADRFDGQTEFEEVPWERSQTHGGFDSEAAVTAEDRTRFDEDEVDPEVDPDFYDEEAIWRWREDEAFEHYDDGLGW